MRTSNRKSPSYTLVLILIFVIALLAGITIWQFITLQSNYLKGQEDISSVKNALTSLEKYANEIELTKDGTNKLQIDIMDPASISNETGNLGETIAIVQNANSQILNTISNFLVVFSILITIVVLIVPLFNYWFLQRDQIKRLDDQYTMYNEQVNNELDRLRKGIDQSIQVSYNVISCVKKNQEGIFYYLVNPISDSSKDKAIACSINSDIYLLRGQLICALQEINKAIQFDPDNAEYYNDRGVTLQALRRYKDALKDNKKAIDLQPNNACYHDSLGVTYHELEQYDKALEEACKAIELDSGNAGFYDSRGATYFTMGKFQEALADMDVAIELEPDNASFYDTRGIMWHEKGRYKNALDDASKAIELNAGNASYYNSRGMTLFMMKRFEEALRDMNMAVGLEPCSAYYYINRWVTLHEMKQYGDALKDANKAIELEPNNASYYDSRALTLLEMRQYEDAQNDANKAINLEPDNARYHNTLGFIYLRIKKYNPSRMSRAKTVELEPDNLSYTADLAYSLYKSKHFSEALDSCTQLGDDINTSSLALRARAMSTLKLALQQDRKISREEREQVMNDLNKAAEIDPENRYSHLDQAQAFFLLEEFDSLRESLEKAVVIDSEEPETYHWFAEYYRAIGDLENATLNDRLANEKGYIPEPKE